MLAAEIDQNGAEGVEVVEEADGRADGVDDARCVLDELRFLGSARSKKKGRRRQQNSADMVQ